MSQLQILALEGPSLKVTAQFNPKELQIDEAISWQRQNQRGKPHLEYTSGEPRSMSLELWFDGFEHGGNVEPLVGTLSQMAKPMPDPKRPPRVKVSWGTIPAFTAVIESLSIKYTMFSRDGTVLRATANMKLKEASAELTVGR